MAPQIHKKFTNDQVKELFQKYLNKQIERKYIQQIIGIGKSRFFELLQAYRTNPKEFSVDYKRSGKTRSIAPEIQDNIIKELTIDKKAIQNKDIPLYRYNYSYIQKRLKKNYGQSVAVSTVIQHAKANGFYMPRPKHKSHDREVLTTYALSPQAKGKIERPYGWLQDHLVRTCIRENVKDINHAQRILNYERDHYNYKQFHSTTKEIPNRRFNSALETKKSLFRSWVIPTPFISLRDIFALRIQRFVDNYHSVTIKNITIKLSDVEPRYPVDIRVYILDKDFYELLFWYSGKLIKVIRQKIIGFLPVYF